MHGLENDDKKSSNLTLNDARGYVMAEKVREADVHSPNRWATGRITFPNQ